MTARLAVSMTLSSGWEAFGDHSPSPMLRWRLMRDGAVLAAVALEVLAGDGATPEEFARRASADAAWRREVAIDSDRGLSRVIVHDLAPHVSGEAPPTLRRAASVTWFLRDGSCVQLTLVTDDLLALGDLGDAARTLARSVQWEETP